MRVFLLALSALIGVVAALTKSDAGVLDWHKRLVGVPLSTSPSTAPVFHRIGQKNTKSVILTATEHNVLAAINPIDGSLEWRHVFQPEDNILAFQKHGEVVVSLSGPGGATFRAFDVLNGDLLLERRLHDPQAGLLLESADMRSPVIITQDYDFVILSNGHTVTYLSKAGNVKWTWTSEDQTSLVIYSELVATPSAIYAVGVAKSYASLTIHVVALSPDTGAVISTAHVPSALSDGRAGILSLTQNTASHIAWLESGNLKTVALSPTLKNRPSAIRGAIYRELLGVSLSSSGYMVAIKYDGTGRVFRLDEESSTVNQIWEFDGSAASSRSTDSIYSGGFDKTGKPYITRLYFSLTFKFASTEIYAPHLGGGRGLVTGFSFPFKTKDYGTITQVAIDAANPTDLRVLGRLFITTSTGTLQLWQQDQPQWTREESLSAIEAAEFVELPEKVVSTSHDGAKSYTERLLRHISDAQDLPRYLANFARRFATGSYASASSSAVVQAEDGALWRDTFGFRRVVLAATPYGKIFALDSSNGAILWSRLLDLGWAAEVGASHTPLKIFMTRTVNDGGEPEAVLVAQRRANNGLVDTVFFHFNALSGEDARDGAKKSPTLQGVDTPDAAIAAFIVNKDDRIVLSLDNSMKAHLYPDTVASKDALLNTSEPLYFPLQRHVLGRRKLTGHYLSSPPDSVFLIAQPSWTLSLPDEEDIQSVIPASRGPVASIGKVLGNRTTLYKYLNPRLFVVLTSSQSVSPASCGVYVVDGAKGSIIYHAAVPVNSGSCNVKATLTENWLVYHHYEDDFKASGQTKGYRMVTVELYEGSQADDKTRSSDLSAFAKENGAVRFFEQSYVFPHAITAIGVTSTKFGITGKDIIVATANHKVQSIPRRLLNPRRPNRKPTAEESEEQLLQYDALLPDDPRRVISHLYDVVNVKHILTSPALLESTSLVFAYGLDLFLTRVAPSKTFDVLNENFNKVQLVLIVLGLGIAIMVTKPIVRNKKLRERWYH